MTPEAVVMRRRSSRRLAAQAIGVERRGRRNPRRTIIPSPASDAVVADTEQ
jgi:hypothetical protein